MTQERPPATIERIHQQEISLLARARTTLSGLELVTEADRSRIEDMIHHLDQLFTVVVVGEFNSGKSSIINALLGDAYLEVGILPTTARINVIRQGRVKARRFEDDLLILTHPSRLLDNMQIVDTPGTNAVFREHEAIARQFIHRSDFVLFVMSATHAFAETDRVYLELIREYGPKVVILLNQIDLLPNEVQIDQVRDFVNEQCQRLFGFIPPILTVSAKVAIEGHESRNPIRHGQLLRQSGIEPVLQLIRDRLDKGERIREKLNTPLRVTHAIASRYLGEVAEQLAATRGDTSVIAQVEAGEHAYRQSVRARLAGRFDPIDMVFERMHDRGAQFIEDNLQVRRLGQLLNWVDFQEDFERTVVADAPRQIADRVNDLVADLISEDRKQWQETLAALRKMLARHQDKVIGTVNSEFAGSLEVFEENVLRAERALNRYSKQDAAESLRDSHLGALANAAMIGISGLVGGGGLLAFAVSELAEAIAAIQTGAAVSALLGPVGWAIGGAAALGGAYVLVQRRLPRARTEARAKLRQEIDALKETFREALTASATRELTLFRSHVQDALTPLQSYLSHLADELEALRDQLGAILKEIEQLQEALASISPTADS